MKDQKITHEKLEKEMNKLMLKKINLQTDFDNAIVEIEKVDKVLSDKDKQIRNIKHELNR